MHIPNAHECDTCVGGQPENGGLINNVDPMTSALGPALIYSRYSFACPRASQIRLDKAEGRDIVRKSCRAIWAIWRGGRAASALKVAFLAGTSAARGTETGPRTRLTYYRQQEIVQAK